MWLAGRNAPEEMLKDGAGMFVSGDGITEGDVSEILQGVIELVISFVPLFPEAVALGEFFRAKGGESEEVVGTVFDHVDAEIIAGVNAKIGAEFVA